MRSIICASSLWQDARIAIGAVAISQPYSRHDDLRHRAVVGEGGGVQQGLGDAVAQRGVQPPPFVD
jgi:hypothetical protein